MANLCNPYRFFNLTPSYITIQTTSTSVSWSPSSIISSQYVLGWEVSGGITIPYTEINDPTFDLSSNSGVAVITVTGYNNFYGVSTFNLSNFPNVLTITSIDLSSAKELGSLQLVNDPISSIDLSNNLYLNFLTLYGLSNITSIDLTNNILLTSLIIEYMEITTLDLSFNSDLIIYTIRNNSSLTSIILSPLNATTLNINNNNLSATVIDNIINQLDTNGVSNGFLNYSNQQGGQVPTSASYTAYNNLITKGWTITGTAPPAP